MVMHFADKDQFVPMDVPQFVGRFLNHWKPDLALFVYLTEVGADGTERYVTEGLLRALHRRERPAPAA